MAVADAPSDSVVVYAILHGRTTMTSGNRDYRLRAGDLAVLDADQPFERNFATPFAELALRVPRATYEQHSGVRAAAPQLQRACGSTALRIGTLSRHLVAAAPTDDLSLAPLVDRLALDLLAGLTAEEGRGDRLALGRLVIEQRLGDPELSASSLAATLGVSQRQLSRLFAEADTSFPRYLTARRLRRAVTLLDRADPPPIAEVAARCGFSSAAYFSRVFRDHYDTPPGRFRTA